MSSNTSSVVSTTMSSAKTTKKTKASDAAAAPAVAAAAPAAAAPAPAKASKKSAKAEAAAAPAVAAAAPAVVEAVAAAAPATEEDLAVSLQKSIAALQEQLNTLKSATHAAATALKAIEKQSGRLAKRAEGRRRKRSSPKAEGAEPKPCIFTKPVKITDELCSFLGKPKGTEISRSAVTKGVMAYAKAHNLMDKQTIKADAALRKLLTLNEGDNLTILNLQKYLGRHYVKPTPVAN